MGLELLSLSRIQNIWLYGRELIMYFYFFLASEMTCKALKLGPRAPILKRQEGGWTFFWSEGND